MEPWLDPVYDAAGMGRADRWAIERDGVPSLELMENAGRALADETASIAGPDPVRVVCGKGNNGGDGLVAARHLIGSGHQVEVVLLWPADQLSPDSTENFKRLPAGVVTGAGSGAGSLASDSLSGSGAVIDAVLGTGFSGTPEAPVDAAIEAINACGAPVVCCDVPSGVNATTGEAGLAVSGDRTVTFHGLKVGHLIAPGKRLTGRVRTAAIGIPPDAPAGEAAGVIRPAVLDLLPARGAASTKFSSGRVTVVGGSPGLTGAVCLAAEGAIRSGAGYATVAVPAGLEPVFEQKLTEVMSLGLSEPDGPGGIRGHLGPWAEPAILEHAANAASVVLGSGIGRADGVAELVRSLVPRLEAPLVVDADGLGSLGADLEPVASRRAPTVLTPHAGEMGRLLGIEAAEVEAHRLDAALKLARECGAIVVLKGDDTIVSDGDRVAVNALPAPSLATAGTGDVLAGVCGAFLGRGLEPFEAAAAAVICHARAGRLAASGIGSAEGVVATDVIASLPRAMSIAPPDDRG
ncbi:MAG: NAD(P)H-hydrate dehydratase [Solirubrobacterales bacterium]|nr:NAD(P)H-hydrate dehydratase [Solirubrobacterales bacterium]